MKTASDNTGLDDLDLDGATPLRDARHFREILDARVQVDGAHRRLREAVRAARDAGESWSVIGAALDTTRQAAQQRFGSV